MTKHSAEQLLPKFHKALTDLAKWATHNTAGIPGQLVAAMAVLKEYEANNAIPDPIDFTRIDNDSNGNPRYVCHYLNFITDNDEYSESNYPVAIARANKLGGRKFHNKQYGGGIVFQSYNTNQLQKDIFELMATYK